MADMAICNERYVEVAIELYDKCSQLARVIFLELGSRGQFGYHSWGLQDTQFVLLFSQVRVPGKTVSNNVEYLLRFLTEEGL